MTNAQRIRSMTDEGLARWLIRLATGDENIKFCKDRPECDADLEQDRDIPQERCAACMLSWLGQTVEESPGTQPASISREGAELHG